MQTKVEFTLQDLQQLFLSMLHGSAMAHTEIYSCPWPNDVKNTFMEITDQALVRGFIKGWLAFKFDTNKVLDKKPMQDIGMLVDALIKVMKGSFSRTVASMPPTTDHLKVFNEASRAAFNQNEAAIQESLKEFNSLLQYL